MHSEIIQHLYVVNAYNSQTNTESRVLLDHVYSCFNQLEFVDFIPPDKVSESSHIVAQGIADWFEYLQKQKVTKLRLAFLPDQLDIRSCSSPLVYTKWFIESESESSYCLWQSSSKMRPASSPDKKPYLCTTYGKIQESKSAFEVQEEGVSVLGQKDLLKNTLLATEGFCNKVSSLHNWGQVFKDARDLLDREKEDASFPELLLPRENHQLLSAADKAYVFGGMGSWNDIYPEDEHAEEFNRVTNHLENQVYKSILMSINGHEAGGV